MCRNEFPGSFVTVFCLSLQPPSGVFPRFPPAEHYGRGLDPARIRSVAGKAMSCQKEKKNSASFYLCFLLTFFAHKRKLTTTAAGQSLLDRKQRADCLQESVMLNEMTGKVSSVCHSHQIHTSQLWTSALAAWTKCGLQRWRARGLPRLSLTFCSAPAQLVHFFQHLLLLPS